MSLQNLTLARLLEYASEDDLFDILLRVGKADLEQFVKIMQCTKKVAKKLPGRHVNVVINTTYGGFELSDTARDRLEELGSESDMGYYDIDRCDPNLIKVVNELGDSANDIFSALKVATLELAPGEDYKIREYDGFEYIETYWE